MRDLSKFIDLAVALGALTVAVASLFVAINESREMNRMVAASSWPYLEYSNSNIARDSRDKEVRLTLRNSGVGPAILKAVEVHVGDKPVHGPLGLLQACCLAEGQDFHGYYTSQIVPGVITPKEEKDFLVLPWTDETALVWDRLNAARPNLYVRVCYCSLFQECWWVDNRVSDPKPAGHCEVAAERRYENG